MPVYRCLFRVLSRIVPPRKHLLTCGRKEFDSALETRQPLGDDHPHMMTIGVGSLPTKLWGMQIDFLNIKRSFRGTVTSKHGNNFSLRAFQLWYNLLILKYHFLRPRVPVR